MVSKLHFYNGLSRSATLQSERCAKLRDVIKANVICPSLRSQQSNDPQQISKKHKSSCRSRGRRKRVRRYIETHHPSCVETGIYPKVRPSIPSQAFRTHLVARPLWVGMCLTIVVAIASIRSSVSKPGDHGISWVTFYTDLRVRATS